MLPLVDKFTDKKESQHILSILISVYARLQPSQKVDVARAVTDRARWNELCADFLSDMLHCRQMSDEVCCWLRGPEFGQFVVQLTHDVCQRPLTMTHTGEVGDISMVNEQSMDDSHWKLLCACLAVDHKSGLMCLSFTN